MGKITNVEITYNNDGVFNPGEPVTGKIRLDISDNVEIYFIKAEMYGRCETKWNKKTNTRSEVHKGSEDYCRQELLLWGCDSSINLLRISGSVEKEFLFHLPSTCPATFSAELGCVVYSITVTCKFSRLFLNKKIKVEKFFTVQDIVDLSLNSSLNLCQPVELAGDFLYTTCCRSKSCHVELLTDKRAYVPDEFIIITGEVTNTSSYPIPMSMTLKRVCIFYGHQSGFSLSSRRQLKSTSLKESLEVWDSEPIPPGRQQLTNLPSVRIPSQLTPSGLRNCHLIEVTYCIEVSLRLSGFCSSRIFAVGEFPLTIGSRICQPEVTSSTQLQPTAPPEDHFNLLSDESEPPPTYDDVIAEDSQQLR